MLILVTVYLIHRKECGSLYFGGSEFYTNLTMFLPVWQKEKTLMRRLLSTKGRCKYRKRYMSPVITKTRAGQPGLTLCHKTFADAELITVNPLDWIEKK